MRLDIHDNDRPNPMTEPTAPPAVCDAAFRAASPGFGWLRHYTRPAGVIQMLYAAFFGWLAYVVFRSGRFYTPAYQFKGGYQPGSFDYQWLITTTLCTLLSVSGFIGGCALLARSPWARRWQVAYLGFIAVAVAAQMVFIQSDVPGSPTVFARGKPPDFTALILFSLMFALPFVPFLFRVPSAARLRAPGKKKPASASLGVSDRDLDG
jgi:hypothetical protein